MNQKQYVILDRDGTVNVERHYLSDPDEMVLLPETISGLQTLRSLGLGLVVVTNQSAIGRGFIDLEQLGAIHTRMESLLAERGVLLDGIYYCPHLPEDGCDCRKPQAGLVLQAARDLGFDPAQAFVIGDKACDIELGRRVGATTFLVQTGYGDRDAQSGEVWPDFIVDDLGAAARSIRKIIGNNVGEENHPGHIPAIRLRRHILASVATKERLLSASQADILAAASVVSTSLKGGGKVLLCGNGGSAADSQHIAAEFVSVLNRVFPRPGLPAIALTTDTSFLTASANDFGFEGIFERQVQALGRPGDVLIGISTSGNSKNVVRAAQYAAAHGIKTIAFTGGKGSALGDCAEVVVKVPSLNVQYIQEAHITVGHMLCDLVERELFD